MIILHTEVTVFCVLSAHPLISALLVFVTEKSKKIKSKNGFWKKFMQENMIKHFLDLNFKSARALTMLNTVCLLTD